MQLGVECNVEWIRTKIDDLNNIQERRDAKTLSRDEASMHLISAIFFSFGSWIWNQNNNN